MCVCIWTNTFKRTDISCDTFIECLKGLLENYYELGSSEAFIELVNKNPVKNDEVLTFKWQKQDSREVVSQVLVCGIIAAVFGGFLATL